MVYIEELEKPELKKTKMVCDCVIDDKLTTYPMVNDCWATTSFNLLLGKMGQGKTSLLVSLLNNKNIFKKCFSHIYICMPESSRKSLANNIFDKYLPKDQVYSYLDADVLQSIYEKCVENSANGEFSILIIDDFQNIFKDVDIVKGLQKIIVKMRHIRTSIWLLQQSFQALPKQLRELTSNIVTYNLGKSQMLKLFDEVIQMDKDKFNEIMDLAFVDKYDWLVINLRNKNMYSKFDRIIYDDEN